MSRLFKVNSRWLLGSLGKIFLFFAYKIQKKTIAVFENWRHAFFFFKCFFSIFLKFFSTQKRIFSTSVLIFLVRKNYINSSLLQEVNLNVLAVPNPSTAVQKKNITKRYFKESLQKKRLKKNKPNVTVASEAFQLFFLSRVFSVLGDFFWHLKKIPFTQIFKEEKAEQEKIIAIKKKRKKYHHKHKTPRITYIYYLVPPPLVQTWNQGLCPMSSVSKKSCRPQAFGHCTLDIGHCTLETGN